MTKHIRAIKLYAALAATTLPAVAQNQILNGTVLTADTGTPIPGAPVIAYQKTATRSQRPAVYTAHADGKGHFTMTVAPGQYMLCVHGAGLFLDPCRWGGAATVTVGSGAVTAAPLRVTRGGRFIVRMHDRKKLLAQSETRHGDAVSVLLTDPSGGQFSLPIIYEDGRVRDYGDILPISIPMRVTVSSAKLQLADNAGAVPSPQGVPFQVSDLAVPSASGPGMFRPPNATMVHVRITGSR